MIPLDSSIGNGTPIGAASRVQSQVIRRAATKTVLKTCANSAPCRTARLISPTTGATLERAAGTHRRVSGSENKPRDPAGE